MKKRFILFVLGFVFSFAAYGQTSLEGKVSDEASAEPVMFATVALYKEGVLMSGVDTDFDGNFFFTDIDPGTYDVEFSFLGYATNRIEGVVVKEGKVNRVDSKMVEESEMIETIIVTGYKVPLVEFDNTTQGGTITAEDIRALPTKDIQALAATTAGISTIDGGDVSIRGSRDNSTFYYIDGVRVNAATVGNNIPQAEIEQMQVITGGIEAKYGDVTGGIISITTKGPSSNFTGGVELESSEFLDAYGYNLINANFSGPIIKNKEGESILGFRVFGQYTKREDDDPAALGEYRLSAEKIADLEANPVTNFNGSPFPSAEFLTEDDIPEPLKTRPNEDNTSYTLTGKLDARVSKNVDLTLSGSYYDRDNRFAPSREWELLNWTNNPNSERYGYRGNFRIRHKLGNQSYGGNEDEKANSAIRNASYNLQFGYEKTFEGREDLRHTDNLFNYGYYGNQARDWRPLASVVTDTSQWDGEIIFVNNIPFAHQGYNQFDGEYTPNLEVNQALSQLYNENGFDDDLLGEVWSLWDNVGQVYNRFSKEEEERYTVNLGMGFDFLPGGSEKGKHNIQFGFTYEQRVNRFWAASPRGLWTLMRLQANRHLESGGVDTNNPIGTFMDPNLGVEFTQYGTNSQEADFADNRFFRKVRELTGQTTNEYVNVDALNPDDLTLDMFSAGELNDRGLINYYGYDYLGNKTSGGLSFNDFFSSRDADGRRDFQSAPLEPIYWAGFIQDKFTYKDIIFRLGLRLDYYDNNTKVLKDPYSLYEIEGANEFHGRVGTDIPESVGEDYRVYIASEGSDNVVAYRNGDQWFLPNGTSVGDANLIFGGGIVTPSIKGADDQGVVLDIRDPNFDPATSFKDYEPQLNWMPRLAFSFPISEDAGFFAHYDVLVQRPPSNNNATPLDYFYFTDVSRFSTDNAPAANPDLRPEKTVDYEVGFQQKISNSSAIKISAYYKELRDLIQRRFYNFVPSGDYETFGNIDFGTVKGLSFSYDMRRTGNIEIKTAYTLQFADGSGSDVESSQGLNERGNLRNIFPLSNDERHRFSTVVDYRFSSGKQYNGPVIGGSDIFANAGANFLITTVSGRPYSPYTNVTTPLGQSGLEGINTSRKPWLFNIDLQVDKNFDFKFSEEGQRSLGLNVYFRVQNLLNSLNVIDLYNVTGDPDDDGYLLSSFGQDRLNEIEASGRNIDSFIAAHRWKLLDPDFYTAPRRIYIGAIISF